MAKRVSTIGNYQLLQVIGEGNFAKVKLGVHSSTKQKVAIKIIDKSKADKETLSKLKREIKTMKYLDHPNIVKLFDVIDSPTHVYLVMEYCSGGELFDFVREKGKLKEKDAKRFFKEILLGVEYCHSKGVLHRDLKLENMLLDENMKIKIADFGFANSFQKDAKMLTFCGTPPYAAPELFLGKVYYGPPVDIWSLGVILYVLVCGSLPFDDVNLQKIRHKVTKGAYSVPFYVSRPCEELMEKIFKLNPEHRISIHAILMHPWVSDGLTVKEEQYKVTTAAKIPEHVHEKALIEVSQMGYPLGRLEEAIKEKKFDMTGNGHDGGYSLYLLVVDKIVKENAKLPQVTTRPRAQTDVKYTANNSYTRNMFFNKSEDRPQSPVKSNNSGTIYKVLKSVVNLVKSSPGVDNEQILKTVNLNFEDIHSSHSSRTTVPYTSFATDTTKFQSISHINSSIETVLKDMNIVFIKQNSTYTCQLPNLEFTLKPCVLPSESIGLTHRRIVGNVLTYKHTCEDILSHLSKAFE